MFLFAGGQRAFTEETAAFTGEEPPELTKNTSRYGGRVPEMRRECERSWETGCCEKRVVTTERARSWRVLPASHWGEPLVAPLSGQSACLCPPCRRKMSASVRPRVALDRRNAIRLSDPRWPYLVRSKRHCREAMSHGRIRRASYPPTSLVRVWKCCARWHRRSRERRQRDGHQLCGKAITQDANSMVLRTADDRVPWHEDAIC